MPGSTDSFSASSSSGNSSDSSAGPDTPLRAASPQLKISDMSSLTLHSPNTQIVGTPFATNCGSTPFEYPFPASPSSSSPTLPSTTSSSSRPPSPGVAIPHPPPVFAPSAILSDPTNTLALSLSMGVPSSSTSPTSDSSTTNPLYHQSKMRMASAPIPPGLIKRRRERAAKANASSDTVLATSGRRGSGSCGRTTVPAAVKFHRPTMPDPGLRLSES